MAKTAKELMAPKAKLHVSVTDTDIRGAKRGDATGCALLRALARTLPRAYDFYVGEHNLRFTLDGHRFDYRGHPWRVEDYLRDFDAGAPAEPFQFWVDDPKTKPVAAKVGTGPKAKRTSAKAAKPADLALTESNESTSASADQLDRLADAVQELRTSPKAADGRGRPRNRRMFGHRAKASNDKK